MPDTSENKLKKIGKDLAKKNGWSYSVHTTLGGAYLRIDFEMLSTLQIISISEEYGLQSFMKTSNGTCFIIDPSVI